MFILQQFFIYTFWLFVKRSILQVYFWVWKEIYYVGNLTSEFAQKYINLESLIQVLKKYINLESLHEVYFCEHKYINLESPPQVYFSVWN